MAIWANLECGSSLPLSARLLAGALSAGSKLPAQKAGASSRTPYRDGFDAPLGGQREPLLDDVVPRYDTLQCTTKHYDEAKQREDWTKDVEKTPADKCKRVFRPLYEDRVTPPFCAMHRGTSRAH
ncbi:MAG: hypothetical protein ACLQVL_04795 [Terriglobia bacterium]